MMGKGRQFPRRSISIIGAFLLLMSQQAITGTENGDAPKIRIMTPTRGYVVGGSGERKFLIGIEIIDVRGMGIFSFDSGLPRFVEPNKNVTIFLDNVIAKSRYTNNLGQEVNQIVALVPLAKLRTADFTITPPIDFKKLRPEEGESKYRIPTEAMAEAAVFNFQVQDLGGARSDSEGGKVIIGFAPEIWSPVVAQPK